MQNITCPAKHRNLLCKHYSAEARDFVMESHNVMPQDAGIRNFMCFLIKVINEVNAKFLKKIP